MGLGSAVSRRQQRRHERRMETDAPARLEIGRNTEQGKKGIIRGLLDRGNRQGGEAKQVQPVRFDVVRTG